MKIRNGFTYKKNKDYYSIGFKTFNNLITKCYIYDSYLDMHFTGVARVNTKEGDIFNQKEGRVVSYAKAMAKRDKVYNKMKIHLLNVISYQRAEIADALDHNLAKLNKTL